MGVLLDIARDVLQRHTTLTTEERRQPEETREEEKYADPRLALLEAQARENALPLCKPRLTLPSGRIVDDANVCVRGSMENLRHALSKVEEATDLVQAVRWQEVAEREKGDQSYLAAHFFGRVAAHDGAITA